MPQTSGEAGTSTQPRKREVSDSLPEKIACHAPLRYYPLTMTIDQARNPCRLENAFGPSSCAITDQKCLVRAHFAKHAQKITCIPDDRTYFGSWDLPGSVGSYNGAGSPNSTRPVFPFSFSWAA